MHSNCSKLGRRPYQEDRFLTGEAGPNDEIKVFAVFDGHGGDHTSDYLQTVFFEDFSPKDSSERSISEALKDSIGNLSVDTLGYKSGSTVAIACVVPGQFAVIAIVGDSIVLVIDKDNINISPEHNIRSNVKEAWEAETRGGKIWDGYVWNECSTSALQMSRALGDKDMGDIVSKTPDIYTVPLNDSSIVLVCTDGLIDPSHTDTGRALDGIVSLLHTGADANMLVDYVEKANGLDDNVTAIVWRPDSV